MSRAASTGEKGTTRLVSRPSEAALELSASFPVALTRSKLPVPSTVVTGEYRVQVTRDLEDAEIKVTSVWRLSRYC